MFNKKAKPYSFLTSNLQNILVNNKWMFFIFLIWAITYFALEQGLLTKRNTITVTGNSMNATKNELATFNVTIESRNASKEKAIEDTNVRSSAIVDAIKSFGINDKDLQTAHMNIYQREESVNGTFKKTDWIANVGIEIKLKDVSRATELSDLISSLDIDNFYGPSFSVDTKNLDETMLLNAALMNAYDKANATAIAMDKKLGEVVYIVEAGSSYSSSYDQFEKAISSTGIGGGAVMEPGATDISKTVTVTYELK